MEELIKCLLTVDGQGFNAKKEALISLLKCESKEVIAVVEKYRRNNENT